MKRNNSMFKSSRLQTFVVIGVCVVFFAYVIFNYFTAPKIYNIKQTPLDDLAKVDTIANKYSFNTIQKNKLLIGSNPQYAPAEFIGDDDQSFIGYEVDLAKAVGKVLGFDVEFKSADFDSIIPAVGSKYDLGVSGFTVTDERKKQLDFIETFKAGENYAVSKNNPFNFPKDMNSFISQGNLCGLSVAVQMDTISDYELDDIDSLCVKQNRKPLDILRFSGVDGVVNAVITKRVKIAYLGSEVSGYANKMTNGEFVQLGDEANATSQGWCFDKSNPDLLKAVKEALQYLVDTGVYERILKYWGVESGAVSEVKSL